MPFALKQESFLFLFITAPRNLRFKAFDQFQFFRFQQIVRTFVVGLPSLEGVLEFQFGLIHFGQQLARQPVQRRNQAFVRQAVTHWRTIRRCNGFEQPGVSVRQAVKLGFQQPRFRARFSGKFVNSSTFGQALIGFCIAQRQHRFQNRFLIFFGKQVQAAADVLRQQAFGSTGKLIIADGDRVAALPFVQFGQHQQADADVHGRDLAFDRGGFDQIVDDGLFEGIFQIGFVDQLTDDFARLFGGEQPQRNILRRAESALQFGADEIHPIGAEFAAEGNYPSDAVRRFGFADDAAQQPENLTVAAQLFKLVEHENVRLPSERFRRIDQLIQIRRFGRAFRPFFLNGAQQTFVGFGRHGFPVMKDRAVAQNVFQPCAQQRSFARARSSTNDDHQDLIVQHQAQQLLQFAFAAKFAKEFAVGFGEGHRPFDRRRTIFGGRQFRRINQSPDANRRVSQTSYADCIKSNLRDLLPGKAVFEFRKQLAADGITSGET